MGRPHIEFVQSLELPAQTLADGPFAGAARRVLSVDEESGASTATLATPAGWSGAVGGDGRPVELFVLRGALELEGRSLAAGCYARVPAGHAALALTGEGDVLVMIDEPQSDDEESVQITDTNELRWVASALAAVPPGLVNKRLRQDPRTGDRTWVASCVPGWMEERAELHPTVEEALMLSGDLVLGTRGAMTPGCYFWRPPMVPHGPMYSRDGAQFFFRTKGGTLEVDYETVPGWAGIVDAYRGEDAPYAGWPADATDGAVTR